MTKKQKEDFKNFLGYCTSSKNITVDDVINWIESNIESASKGLRWVKASELKEINWPICIKMDGGGAPYYTTVCSMDELGECVTDMNPIDNIFYLSESATKEEPVQRLEEERAMSYNVTEDELKNALSKYCSPHGNHNPETYAYITGLRDGKKEIQRLEESLKEAVELLKEAYKLHPLREGQNILKAGMTFKEAITMFNKIQSFINKHNG